MSRSAWGLEVARDQDWRQYAKCGPDTAEWFFVEDNHVGRSGTSAKNRQALQICGDCPVMLRCRDDAIDHPEPFTRIAGGMVVRRVKPAEIRRVKSWTS